MKALEILFWISLFIVFYTYIGYGILLYILVKIKECFRKPTPPSDACRRCFAPIDAVYRRLQRRRCSGRKDAQLPGAGLSHRQATHLLGDRRQQRPYQRTPLSLAASHRPPTNPNAKAKQPP